MRILLKQFLGKRFFVAVGITMIVNVFAPTAKNPYAYPVRQLNARKESVLNHVKKTNANADLEKIHAK
jgi:hypothetical protein